MKAWVLLNRSGALRVYLDEDRATQDHALVTGGKDKSTWRLEEVEIVGGAASMPLRAVPRTPAGHRHELATEADLPPFDELVKASRT